MAFALSFARKAAKAVGHRDGPKSGGGRAETPGRQIVDYLRHRQTSPQQISRIVWAPIS
jgi:hypothetical protein